MGSRVNTLAFSQGSDFVKNCCQSARTRWSGSSEAGQVLEQCVEALMGWMRDSKWKLNHGEIELLWIGGSWDQEIGMPVLYKGALHHRDRCIVWGGGRRLDFTLPGQA